MSVATWSLRERAVWSRPAAAPIFSCSRRSMFMWMSSSSGRHGKLPDSISSRISPSPATMASASSDAMIPCRASIRACAIDPAMSCRYNRLS